ncbi:MAG: branched-chain amino acid aminotransferase [Candidatus Competibacteraceae bacterium]|nr:branched-chain amino acid aminotransferase [Candidatus Competibacteraceae bacterium]
MTTTDSLNIQIEKTSHSSIHKVDFDQLPFGKYFGDHMFSALFRNEAWSDFRILPFGPISMHPSMAALHYGQSIFEGMKAYRADNGDILLFRPWENARRLNRSAERLCMATIPEEYFMDALSTLIDIDREWVSGREGHSLYIRPFMFASEAILGVRPAQEYTFMIFTSPVGNYYNSPVKLMLETHYSRATKGGTGTAKAAGNYAAALYPAKLGQLKGYSQQLWTDSSTHQFIEESGTMNIFFVMNGKLITPSLESDTILSGITRDSIIQVARHWRVPVEERAISVDELDDAIQSGALTDMFGAGTAATIAHVELVNIRGVDRVLPDIKTRQLSNDIARFLSDIRTGKADDIFEWTYRLPR